MAHLTSRTAYQQLVERLNRFPLGAPPSDLLDRILKLLVTEQEANLLSRVPIKPFNIETAAHAWNVSPAAARKILDELASRALILDVERDGVPHYVLPPPMAGFFEFSMMRVREDVDQATLASLYYQYLNVEEDFVRALGAGGGTQLGRVFVNEDALENDGTLLVLDYERASEVIHSATMIGVGVCYCRHKMAHVGRACKAPLEICMTFSGVAHSLIEHRFARKCEPHEAMDLLQEARDRGLVQFGENVRRKVGFMCHCCGCCCEAMIGARRLGMQRFVHTTSFLPIVDMEKCSGCSKCVSACPVEAVSLVSANDPHHARALKARVSEEACLGCGVCTRACPSKSLSLVERKQRVIPPLNSAHKTVLMALERGKLQELLFDDQTLASHRILAAVFGAVLRLPPVKRALATDQIRSRYLESLCARWEESAHPE